MSNKKNFKFKWKLKDFSKLLFFMQFMFLDVEFEYCFFGIWLYQRGYIRKFFNQYGLNNSIFIKLFMVFRL